MKILIKIVGKFIRVNMKASLLLVETLRIIGILSSGQIQYHLFDTHGLHSKPYGFLTSFCYWEVV